MFEWFMSLELWVQALLGGTFTWFVTALGAALVFFFKNISKNVLGMMYGVAAGVMVAASFWSLLAPGIEIAEEQGSIAWLVAAIGFSLGGIFLFAADKIIPHMHFGKEKVTEGITTKMKRSILLVFSITLHNIPEGLAIGVAFGAIGATTGSIEAATVAAMVLALGIGIQNFPEGAAVSIPLSQEKMGKTKAFMWGQASALVEPVFAVLGAVLVTSMSVILPYALAFAAGAMIYVVVEELIPEAQENATSGTHFAVFGFMLGFIIMMILDVALG
jgi:ZIP family zinc transporter